MLARSGGVGCTDLVPVTFNISPGANVNLCCSPSTGGQSCVTAQVEQWNVTFVITAGDDDNHVSVDVSSTNGKVISDSGWYNEGIPPGSTVAPCTPGIADQFGNITYTGTVSASQLTLASNQFPTMATVGTFNFTSSTLTGTFVFASTDGYEVNESTADAVQASDAGEDVGEVPQIIGGRCGTS